MTPVPSGGGEVAVATAVGARSVGARVQRVEDGRILTGRGRYVDDVALPGMLHAAFLRSPVPHGRLLSVDASEARALPGVVAVYTGDDIRRLTNAAEAAVVSGYNQVPGMRSPSFHALATDKVRYAGDPIALVVAESRYVAEDALELIVADIEMLEPVVGYDDALDPAKPPLFDELGDNVNLRGGLALGDVDAAFAQADRVVRATIDVHRQHPLPMECRGTIASWDAEAGQLTIHTSTQSPHMLRMVLPAHVDVPTERIRVLAGDVGGGFGLKNAVAREDVAVVAAAMDLGRPVKWIEDRLEHLATAGHAREEVADVEAAVRDDGLLLGVRLDIKVNVGAYPSDPFPGALQAFSIPQFFQGPTRIEGLAATSVAVFSNKASYVSYRGPWATGDFLRERLLDLVAHELSLDPLDVRRRNYVVRDEPPLAMLTGRPFTGVTTRETVEQAARLIDDELLVEVRVPVVLPGAGWSLYEIAPRHGDFALVGVAAMVDLGGDRTIGAARVCLFGVADRPVRATTAEAALTGARPSADGIAAAAAEAVRDLEPGSDMHGSAAYRRHLAEVAVRRALTAAAERAQRPGPGGPA